MRFALSVTVVAALSSVSLVAFAQPKADPRANQGPLVLRRGDASGQQGQAARARARGGDCKSALGSFDAALETSVEPTLRRDRGLCHEQLGHPYPAIDDYRAYLVGKPDAPDADQIRGRLAALEQQVGQGGSENPDRSGETSADAEASADASVGKGRASASTKASFRSKGQDKPTAIGPKSGEQEQGYDYYRAEERQQDEADSTGLRNGTGWIVGAFVHVPRFFFGSGATSDMGYGVGGALRYATGPTITVAGEVGYGGVGASGSNTAFGGLLTWGGIEARIPVTKYAADHFVLGGGLGFERYTLSGTRLSSNLWSGRFRAGFRHVFGPQVGIEFLVDGGPVLFDPDGTGSSRVNGVVGGSLAFLVAF